ncbi:hypothetical protein, partial [Treponema sp. R6D11]
MEFKKYIFLCILPLLLFSCNKKKEQPVIIESIAEEEIYEDPIEIAKEKEREEIKEIIYKNDQYFQERDAEIVFIEKANFGIPGGDNW